MVAAVGATAQTANNTGVIADDTKTALGKFAENFDDFLTLFVAQLKNQDPLEPQDSSEFTKQIATLTGVEQQINTNKKLDSLIHLTQNTQNSNLVSFAGKEVEVEGSFLELNATDPVLFAYNLETQVNGAFLTIKDSSDNVVFTGQGSKIVGRNEVGWDGLDNAGNRAPAGTYQIFITTENKEGIIDTQKALVRGKVSGVDIQSNPPTLYVNGEKIPLADVKFIGESVTTNSI